MTVTIETVGTEAASLLATLHRGCIDPGGERAWSAREFADLLRLPTIWAAVAADEREKARDPIGFVLCSSAGDEAELLFIGVLPGRRRCGAGHALLSAALAMARRRGLRRVLLEVAADNLSASRLYTRLAFSQVGRRAQYYHRQDGEAIDAVVMQLLL